MNTQLEAEDALLAVSRLQRSILTAGVAMCYSALDNGGTTMTTILTLGKGMKTIDMHSEGPRYHAWSTNLHTGEVTETDLDDDQVVDMVELDPVDVDAAIEAAGWCGALGATYGFPFVICPYGTEVCPPKGVAFMRATLVAKG